ncbi:ParB/RepB/Spo0J family partition protein [Paenibacillus sp. XY044]|uniref:ParB/RepB/Spo0J family partition protein n=1 Tax=Paenibacillus sp. XY044 TaxID=2026089 RepID=UPI0015C691A1|nr:ParB/RepB/Spo0J family partition protein [Paenibacillus sp. XY044]
MNFELIPIKLIDESTILTRDAHDNIEELAKNISEIGLLQPITVKKLQNGNYRIILGARRYKAVKLLKKTHIPANISNTEDETEIYLQQLAENMERENFSPIEEAKLFYKLTTDPVFHKSELYISQKIGKNERYIKRKLELLKFGKDVQEIIHAEKEILPNKLNEEQALSLKKVDIIFKDKLALKAASEQVSVNDLKRAAQVYTSKELDDESKFTLLALPFHDIVETWSILEEKKIEKQRFADKPRLANATTLPSHKEDHVVLPTVFTEIEVLLKSLISSIPSHRSIHLTTIYSYENIPIDRKQDFLKLIDGLVTNLQAHLIEWRKIKDIVKTPIRLVDTSKQK